MLRSKGYSEGTTQTQVTSVCLGVWLTYVKVPLLLLPVMSSSGSPTHFYTKLLPLIFVNSRFWPKIDFEHVVVKLYFVDEITSLSQRIDHPNLESNCDGRLRNSSHNVVEKISVSPIEVEMELHKVWAINEKEESVST